MKPGQDFAICCATIFLAIIVWREITWGIRLRHWKKTTGYVTKYWVSGDGVGGSTIRYRTQHGEEIFDAPYCLSNPSLGETVDVLYDPTSSKAALLTKRHRWFPTMLCLGIFLLMIFIAWRNHTN